MPGIVSSENEAGGFEGLTRRDGRMIVGVRGEGCRGRGRFRDIEVQEERTGVKSLY